MKLECGLSPRTRTERRAAYVKAEANRLMQWHSWFALLPVRIGDNDCRWLETVERRIFCDLENCHERGKLKCVIFYVESGSRWHVAAEYRALEKP